MIKDSWEYRKARMHPQISRMDMAILLKFKTDPTIKAAGWKVEFQRTICLVPTTPDFIVTKGDTQIGLYLDGEQVHKKRQERDEWLRGMLERKGVTPFAISYPDTSDAWVERVWKQIKEALI